MFEAHKKWSEVETEMNKYFPLHLIFCDYYDKVSPPQLGREVNCAASGRMVNFRRICGFIVTVCGKQYAIFYIKLTYYGKKRERKIMASHYMDDIFYEKIIM